MYALRNQLGHAHTLEDHGRLNTVFEVDTVVHLFFEFPRRTCTAIGLVHLADTAEYVEGSQVGGTLFSWSSPLLPNIHSPTGGLASRLIGIALACAACTSASVFGFAKRLERSLWAELSS